MEKIEHREQFEVRNGLSMEPFVEALLPLLRFYGLELATNDYPYLRNTSRSVSDKFDAIIGDVNGAYLKYSECYYPGCGFDGRGTILQLLVSLFRRADTGEMFVISLSISEFENDPNHLMFSFTGSLEDFECTQRAIAPVLTSHALDSGKVLSHIEH